MNARTRPLDEAAAAMPWMASMSACLHVPIAAKSREAIEQYVGQVVREFPSRSQPPSFVVAAHQPPPPDTRRPVWDLTQSEQLHQREQVWAHVDCRSYRRVFVKAFPDVDLTGMDIDHVLNREIARLKGFPYVRLMPIVAAANRGAGALAEKWGIDYHRSERMQAIHRQSLAQIQYADISDLVKMLNINPGGGVMDVVNAVKELFEIRESH